MIHGKDIPRDQAERIGQLTNAIYNVINGEIQADGMWWLTCAIANVAYEQGGCDGIKAIADALAQMADANRDFELREKAAAGTRH